MSQRDWIEKDYYAVLGLTKNASKDEIKKAYRKLAQRYHPDANAGDNAAESRFKEISEAHSILSNDEKRAEYDQMRSFVEAGGERFYGFTPGRGGGVRVNIGDLFGGEGSGLFDEMFGFRPRGPSRGEDIETSIELGFEEAVSGSTVALSDGTKVRIPAGVTPGSRIKVRSKGGPGTNGGAPGDLYVRVHVQPHPIFHLGKEGNLTIELPVAFTEAALGAKVEVPTLEAPVTVKVPAGTPNGKTLRVKGKGAPRANGGTGDLFVKVMVQVPQKLTRKEKEILEELAAAQKESPREHLESFMNRGAKAS